MKRILSIILCLFLLIPAAAPAESADAEKAVSRAQIYLDMYPFSRQEIIDQLVFDGFSAEDAEYAADNCDADWTALAVRAATQMLSYFPETTREDLLNILLTSGYTQEQAEAGVTAAMGDGTETASGVPVTATAPTAEPTETPEPIRIVTRSAVDPPAPTPVPIQITVSIVTDGIPYENLRHIRNQLTEEIFFRGDWNQVEIMGGEWTVGVDLPAGFYSVRTKDGKYASLDVTSTDAYRSHTYFTIEEGGEIGKLELKDGMVLDFSRTLLFGKPKTLGF